MNTEMQRRALAARDAHLALLDLKRVVDEAAQTTHAADSKRSSCDEPQKAWRHWRQVAVRH